MATEGPLLHDGSQNTLSTANDFRNSAITGTTLAGPNGSGQFLAVVQSTQTARTVSLSTNATPTFPVGIVQNKPAPGGAVDIGIFGITKAVNGSTAAIVTGTLLQLSTINAGTLIGFTPSTSAVPCARLIEAVAAGSSQSIMTVQWFGFGSGPFEGA